MNTMNTMNTMKKITLKRFFHTDVTLGEVMIDGVTMFYSLELPYKDNRRNISCIPTGTYELKIRTTTQRGEHLLLTNVPNRSFILIHSGNSVKDIQGCILLGDTIAFKVGVPHRILNSKIAVEKFNAIVFKMLKAGEQVFLEIV